MAFTNPLCLLTCFTDTTTPRLLRSRSNSFTHCLEVNERVDTLIRKKANSFFFSEFRYGGKIRRLREKRDRAISVILTTGSSSNDELETIQKILHKEMGRYNPLNTRDSGERMDVKRNQFLKYSGLNKSLVEKLRGTPSPSRRSPISDSPPSNVNPFSPVNEIIYYRNNQSPPLCSDLDRFSQLFNTINHRSRNKQILQLKLGEKEYLVEGLGNHLNARNQIEALKGAGAFGRTYVGNEIIRDPRTGEVTGNNRVAIKATSIPESSSSLKLENLKNEGRFLTELSGNDNIIETYQVALDTENTPPMMFIVMENMDGGELFDYCSQNNAPDNPAHTRLELMRQVANGLNIMHSQGIMHRDVKPENVLLKKDPQGKATLAKIIDFGLSTRTSDKPKSTVGSRPYIAPEILNPEKEQTPAVDTYAFGVMLAEVFTETQTGFDHEDIPHSLRNRMYKDIELSQGEKACIKTQLGDEIGDRVIEIVHACLKKEPSQRPSMEEIERGIRDLLTN